MRKVIVGALLMAGALTLAPRAGVTADASGDATEIRVFVLDKTGSPVDVKNWTGAVDVMRVNHVSPINVQFHLPAIDPRYKNRRMEIHWKLAEWVKGGGALPPVPELVGELTTPTYTFSGGKMLLEEKDQVKKRLGRSPDLADALALTFGLVDMPAGMRPAVAVSRGDGEDPQQEDPWRWTT